MSSGFKTTQQLTPAVICCGNSGTFITFQNTKHLSSTGGFKCFTEKLFSIYAVNPFCAETTEDIIHFRIKKPKCVCLYVDVNMWVCYRQWRCNQCRSPESISGGLFPGGWSELPTLKYLCYPRCNWGIRTIMVDMTQDLQEICVLPEQQWKARREVLVHLSISHFYVAAS